MKQSLILPFVLLAATVAGAREVETLADLPEADVFILGEVHDNPAHHENQAGAVADVQPGAIVFEMLTPEQAAAVETVERDDEDALTTALGWAESGWPDFALYHPIFTAAPDARIYGGALPREEVRRAMTEGAAEVFGADADAYDLGEALPPGEQTAREAEQRVAHCNALPEDLLPGMVEAQRLRDAALARATVQAAEQTGGPVVVITGTGHARRDWGIPAALAKVAPELSVLSVGQLEAPPEEDPPFDFWLVAPAPERADPCEAFR